ncbi:MAG: helix-turn-helix domain-containing protein [Clostridia bacterium]|nr:helix-turn-helix domain-containing protein [Clostridia bacterium]
MSNVFDGLYTITEVAKIYDLDTSTIRKHISKNKFKVDVEIKKFGNTWILHESGFTRVYGKTAFELYKNQI